MCSSLLDDQQNLRLLRDLVHDGVVPAVQLDFFGCDDLGLVLPQVKVLPERPVTLELVPLLALVAQVERDLTLEVLLHPATSVSVEVWGVEHVRDVEDRLA